MGSKGIRRKIDSLRRIVLFFNFRKSSIKTFQTYIEIHNIPNKIKFYEYVPAYFFCLRVKGIVAFENNNIYSICRLNCTVQATYNQVAFL